MTRRSVAFSFISARTNCPTLALSGTGSRRISTMPLCVPTLMVGCTRLTWAVNVLSPKASICRATSCPSSTKGIQRSARLAFSLILVGSIIVWICDCCASKSPGSYNRLVIKPLMGALMLVRRKRVTWRFSSAMARSRTVRALATSSSVAIFFDSNFLRRLRSTLAYSFDALALSTSVFNNALSSWISRSPFFTKSPSW